MPDWLSINVMVSTDRMGNRGTSLGLVGKQDTMKAPRDHDCVEESMFDSDVMRREHLAAKAKAGSA